MNLNCSLSLVKDQYYRTWTLSALMRTLIYFPCVNMYVSLVHANSLLNTFNNLTRSFLFQFTSIDYNESNCQTES